ncbi:MAG: sulfatase-like hydrolase/transferase [Planctomycetota bacterium]|jgi:arylsulfatase A-like enzyme
MKSPNLLVIHTDQLSSFALSCYGAKGIETPNIDRLAIEGVKFNNFFTNSAWCTPSRGIMFSGRYPHCNGAFANHIELNRDEVTFGEICRQAGYNTGYVGKWHLDGDSFPGWVHKDRSMGFDYTRYMFNRGSWKKFVDMDESIQRHKPNPHVYDFKTVGDEKSYSTDFLSSKVIEYIEEQEKNFCCICAIEDPHPAHMVRAPYDTMFKPEDMELPESFYDENIPSWADTPRAHGSYALDNPHRENNLRLIKSQYFGQVKCIDDNVGKIIKSLEDKGVLDDTVVVFTTDHGEYMGEHTIKGKDIIYETAYRIPLIIRYPEKIKAGVEVENFVSMVDLQQTILDLVGLSPSGREQGRSAVPLINGKEIDWQDEIHLYHGSCTLAGIVTPQYTIAFDQKENNHILFDRIKDPLQMNNLISNDDMKETIKQLHSRVLEHHKEFDSPAAEWLPSVVNS